ncbi:MAG: GntR family transcriptional regulator [Cardiobacteriaceae bacterium]|nr:GntR family transcriptional regulator [Cardiobacteriaceae bacterium]
MTSGLGSTRLYRQLVDSLQQGICAERYPVGSYLPSERDLSKQFMVSRSTVREAIIALEVLGWIEVRSGSGALVLGEGGGQSALPFASPTISEKGLHQSSVSPAPSHDAIKRIHTTSSCAHDWWNARLLLEPEAAALAARHKNPSALAAIKEAFLQSVAEDMHGHHDFQGIRLFYQRIAQASENGLVADLVEQLLNLAEAITYLQAYHQKFAKEQPFYAQQERLGLLSALECGDESLARYRLRSQLMAGL